MCACESTASCTCEKAVELREMLHDLYHFRPERRRRPRPRPDETTVSRSRPAIPPPHGHWRSETIVVAASHRHGLAETLTRPRSLRG